jgi:excisionase family DNA binding protein
MNADPDRRQLTAALHVVVDHVADQVVERVMQLLETRLERADQAHREDQGCGRETKGADTRRQRPADSPDLMTLREAAGYLNRPLSTLQFFVHRLRAITKYKVGGRVMVKRADLDAFIERGRQPNVLDLLEAQRSRRGRP